MTKAYENGAKKMWIVNVGDIKPAEYDTEFFLDLAWDINSIKSDGINDYLKKWISREFRGNIASELSFVLKEYYRLAFLRKPEYMGWSQTEPTTPVKLSDFSAEESQNRITAYNNLIQKVDSLSAFIPAEKKDAWFQLVVYPVKGAAYMNHKFLYWKLVAITPDESQREKCELLSAEAYQKIKELTDFYNTKMSNGKWNHMMSMHPRNLPVFDSIKKTEFSKEVSISETSNKTFIQANQFVAKKGVNEYQWKTINGLGYSDNAITLFPLKQHYFKTEKPSVSYEFEIEKAGDYEIEIHLPPTHSNNFDYEIEVQTDGDKTQSFSINSKERDKTWKENVLRNSAIVKLPVSITNIGKHTITITVNQTGIVLDYITVNAK